MKTTHEKLLTSLLALGLTSSAGLYAQSTDTNNTLIVNGGGLQTIDPRNEDTDGDGFFDVNEDLADIGVLNNGGTGPIDPVTGNPTFRLGEGALLDEDTNNNGVLDAGEDLNGNGILETALNEDIDGDCQLDTFNEDVNGNGTLDNTDRTFLEAFNPDTDARRDLDILVENGLFVNGEIVATENYVDAADDVVRAEFAAADAILQNQIDTNVRDIAKNREDIDANTRGIAMVAALQHTTVLPGMTHALDISGAHFEGETGMALNYARRINENVQINFGAASTTDFDETVIKAGVGVQW